MARIPRSLLGHKKVFTRSLTYKLPETPVFQTIRASETGFPGLYSHKAFNDLWFNQGEKLTARLNHEIQELGVTNTSADLNELIASTFNTPELRNITTSASKLHNLQFCLESLRPNESAQDAVPTTKPGVEALLETPSIETKFENEPTNEALREWIEDSFGSIAEFRTLLLNSAKAIKGDGITWLVAEASYSESSLRSGVQADLSFSKLAVMNTYNAGIVDDSVRSGQLSKLKQQKAAREEAAARRQQERNEMENSASEQPETADETTQVTHDDTVLGTVEEAEEALLYSDKKLVPLLAVDASMKAYLADYGVFGKSQYLENVWRCINWDVVSERAPGRFKPSVVFDQ
ncbi:hypothetical protein JCM33374_g5503 [Metschnikowia sp. JCM 33374]|nr:hypothetical protein JCM33374_g5503 [Metschnikowia sp. JCM 33374]